MTILTLSTLLLLSSFQDPQAETERDQWRRPVHTVSLLMIGRNVDDAEPADEQLGWGIEFDMYDPRSFGWEIGISRTSDDASAAGADVDAKVMEVYTGGRKTWAAGNLRPYVGVGVSFVEAEVDVSGVGSEDDNSFGLYGHGGAYWTFGGHFNLGADVRTLVGTDLDFGDANYVQLALVLGYSM